MFRNVETEDHQFGSPKKTNANNKITPKTTLGPDSSIKQFHLLYLYFDCFKDVQKAYEDGELYVACHDASQLMK